jgi:hypothetical protein
MKKQSTKWKRNNLEIVVCGDSFCSRDENAPGKHFSEQLEGTVTNLARGGISNSAIFMQLHKALALDPDVIIYSITDPARMTVPAKPNWNAQFSTGDPLANIRYKVDGPEPFVSHTIPCIMGEMDLGLDPAVIDAVKSYFNVLYDAMLQDFLDREMFAGYKSRAKQQNIQVINLNNQVTEVYDEARDLNDNPVPEVFHTTHPTQTVAAERIMDLIRVNKINN